MPQTDNLPALLAKVNEERSLAKLVTSVEAITYRVEQAQELPAGRN